MLIYDYLHEKSIYYQYKKEEMEQKLITGESVSPEDWMIGIWMPMMEQVDPAEHQNKKDSITSKFFPLTGNLFHLCTNRH